MNPWHTKYFEQSFGWGTKSICVFEQSFVLKAWGSFQVFLMGAKNQNYIKVTKLDNYYSVIRLKVFSLEFSPFCQKKL